MEELKAPPLGNIRSIVLQSFLDVKVKRVSKVQMDLHHGLFEN